MLEIEEEGKIVAEEDLNYSTTSTSIEFSPTIQSTIDLINAFVTRHGIPNSNVRVVGGSS